MTKKEEYAFKRELEELGKLRGRHTELISVYIPDGYELSKVVGKLSEEQGTSSNIKSKTVRKNVTGALEKIIQHLRLFKRTPKNGLAVFCGNTSENEGTQDLQLFSIIPNEPLKIALYRCSQRFVLDPLADMMKEKQVYGLIVMDRSDATIGFLKGRRVDVAKKLTSMVPGKTKAGGQCLHPETLIPLQDGNLAEVGKIDNHNLFSLDLEKHSLQKTKCIDKWEKTKPKSYRIVTKFPKTEIVASGDHLFFVLGKDGVAQKPAEELDYSDFLLMTEKLNVKGKKHRIDISPYPEYIVSEDGRNLIKKKRLEKKLLQRELAKKIGLTQTAISFLEIGKRGLTSQNLKKLCKELGLNYSSFARNHCSQQSNVKLPKEIGREFAQILGYYLGDGSAEKDRLSFFEGNKQLILAYKKKIDSLFALKTSLRHRESKNYYQLRATSRPLVKLFKDIFPEIKKSRDSTIPEKICTSSDEIVAAFLRGLYDAEGYVSEKLAIGMNNNKLLQQVRLLLLRFGIISSLYTYDNRRNPYSNNLRYTLEIGEKESLRLFIENIGFESSKKMKKLRNFHFKHTEQSYVRRIPVKGSHVRELAESIGLLKNDFPKVSNFFFDQRNMSKLVFKRSVLPIFNKRIAKIRKAGPKNLIAIANSVEKELNILINSNLIPVRIAEIHNSTKKTKLVDISTDKGNFLANGLLVHNSAARYARVREGLINDWYKEVGDTINEIFGDKELLGIILGGPGPIKNNFLDGGYLPNQILKKIIGTIDQGYTDEYGLQELVNNSQDILKDAEITKEKQLVGDFLLKIATTDLAAYGEDHVRKALEIGAVETLLISEDADSKIADELVKLAETSNTNLEFISTTTPEGEQFFRLGGFGALLRFKID